MTDEALASFSAVTRHWFGAVFREPTPAQAGAWEAIARGEDTLVVAPTGSGKTLAAFLFALDRTLLPGAAEGTSARAGAGAGAEAREGSEGSPGGVQVIYLSPLKALGTDIERNLRSPLVGIARAASHHGQATREVRVGIRTGDTTPAERRRQLSDPPDILITTPESLYLLLTSSAREGLRDVHTVIVDEIHAVAGTKRGSHLAVSLARLDAIQRGPAPQRIGLSATVRPVDTVARFLGGARPVTVVDPASPRAIDLTVRGSVPDMTDLAGGPALADAGQSAAGAGVPSVGQLVDPRLASATVGEKSASEGAGADESESAGEDAVAGASEAEARPGSIWPYLEAHIAELIGQHRSTIVFTNSRGQAERLTARLNELAEAPIARAHHGSVSKEQRAQIEDALKAGELTCVVATSSLELGIDMGDVDLVIQVTTPPSVASGLQRVGRAGHQVGQTSRGVFFPTHRADVVASAVVVQRMRDGQLEELRTPANPLDILAQQTVAAAAMEDLDVDAWFALLRTTAPFANLPRALFEATLDMLAGRYPSDEFAELRPRIVWDRAAGVLSGRPGAQRLAVTSGGTIPDRGLFPVYLAGGDDDGEKRRAPLRVGELDEEMVYESRTGDVIALGASSWRITEITHDRVSVIPAPGLPSKVPFWHGEGGGRPAELGEAIGEFVRTVGERGSGSRGGVSDDLDNDARANLTDYLAEQRAATGTLPSDRTLVVERFEDELGDWRVVLLSPYGLKVHAPWALAIGERIEEAYGTAGDVQASDDGIVLRLPRTDAPPEIAPLISFEPGEIEDVVVRRLGASALFAARFRECAARALLLPRRYPGKRSPLWQQRRRSAQLLDVARGYPDFPIIFETLRECLADVYDVAALARLLARIAAREVAVVEVETASASPFAQSLLFSYVGQFLYEGDQPLAERKAAVLALDQGLLDELLGRARLRELFDADVIVAVEADLQRLSTKRRLAGGAEAVADLLRLLGPLSADELAARLQGPDGSGADADDATAAATAAAWADELVAQSRAVLVRLADSEVYVAIEDAARTRDVYGVVLPPGVPRTFLEPVAEPLRDVVARYARTHAPFTLKGAAADLALAPGVIEHALVALKDAGRVTDGEFTPGIDGVEWVDTRVLAQIRRRCLAVLRSEVEPVDQRAYARFLPAFHHLEAPLTGTDGLLTAIDQLAGVALPASAWESLVLPPRVADYAPHLLDAALATGEVIVTGAGRLGADDGWIAFHLAEAADLTLAEPTEEPAGLAARICDVLAGGGGFRHGEILQALADAGERASGEDVTDALWELFFSGHVTNDSLAALRSRLRRGGTHRAKSAPPSRRSSLRRGAGRLRPPRLARGSLSTTNVAGSLAVAVEQAAGRWSLVRRGELEAHIRASATAELMLDRHGVVTRGSLLREDVPGGFAALYRVLATLEDAGSVRRGHFIAHLGGAQFAHAATVDLLRDAARADGTANDAEAARETADSGAPPIRTLALAASDPANAYGAALAWPEPVSVDDEAPRHRPARRAGGVVILHGGDLLAYIERGGRSLLIFTDDASAFADLGPAIARVVAAGALARVTIESVAGVPILSRHPLAAAVKDSLTAAGFTATPKGMRLRA
ncbi:hypothetical protein BSZ39_09005 [Bowdeniella nasicola]|uniref:ATP-dependent helicase Lhr and Lhr-like helicase n=1 Tax=Bowdeniella nasicola TaxID=208480 RepID=A0A1Q5Q130_9ACTO|nr:DEAD/DEAH box helicase [Bowdeniella nasicola]OKL53541.1 hypothetical protein BSZ39_09005 [Bowdeniella nasicola]